MLQVFDLTCNKRCAEYDILQSKKFAFVIRKN